MLEARSTLPSTREFRKELEKLYARRSAIDEVIQTLEEYDRFHGSRIERRRGTARRLGHSLKIA